MCENLLLICAVFRIAVYSFFRRLCGFGPPPAKPNFTVLCLGLEGSGKSSLLAVLSGEKYEDIPPTIGFSIKALMFDDCIVDVKELGGRESVRPYWDRYYAGAQGIIFVVDSTSSDENLKLASNELHKALGDPVLDDLPLLVLCSYQDKQNAKSPTQIQEILEVNLEDGHRPWTIHGCSIQDRESIKESFEKFNEFLLHPSHSKSNNSANNDFSRL
ncbi:ADP-ribosylation factor-like protein 15 [Ylistrum balloti]|uniref:ADP-ribosylation factor-like protein 15 n=1 Tax=Ylistrum balloti TaxID=509963 RepID=UPI002905807C|nr:ADP-ribosylation factor-like protein 15 [Ylistrum balloti]